MNALINEMLYIANETQPRILSIRADFPCFNRQTSNCPNTATNRTGVNTIFSRMSGIKVFLAMIMNNASRMVGI